MCHTNLKFQTSSRTIEGSKLERAAEEIGSCKPGVLLYTPQREGITSRKPLSSPALATLLLLALWCTCEVCFGSWSLGKFILYLKRSQGSLLLFYAALNLMTNIWCNRIITNTFQREELSIVESWGLNYKQAEGALWQVEGSDGLSCLGTEMNGKSTELWCAAMMLHVVCKGRQMEHGALPRP